MSDTAQQPNDNLDSVGAGPQVTASDPLYVDLLENVMSAVERTQNYIHNTLIDNNVDSKEVIAPALEAFEEANALVADAHNGGSYSPEEIRAVAENLRDAHEQSQTRFEEAAATSNIDTSLETSVSIHEQPFINPHNAWSGMATGDHNARNYEDSKKTTNGLLDAAFNGVEADDRGSAYPGFSKIEEDKAKSQAAQSARYTAKAEAEYEASLGAAQSASSSQQSSESIANPFTPATSNNTFNVSSQPQEGGVINVHQANNDQQAIASAVTENQPESVNSASTYKADANAEQSVIATATSGSGTSFSNSSSQAVKDAAKKLGDKVAAAKQNVSDPMSEQNTINQAVAANKPKPRPKPKASTYKADSVSEQAVITTAAAKNKPKTKPKASTYKANADSEQKAVASAVKTSKEKAYKKELTAFAKKWNSWTPQERQNFNNLVAHEKAKAAKAAEEARKQREFAAKTANWTARDWDNFNKMVSANSGSSYRPKYSSTSQDRVNAKHQAKVQNIPASIRQIEGISSSPAPVVQPARQVGHSKNTYM